MFHSAGRLTLFCPFCRGFGLWLKIKSFRICRPGRWSNGQSVLFFLFCGTFHFNDLSCRGTYLTLITTFVEFLDAERIMKQLNAIDENPRHGMLHIKHGENALHFGEGVGLKTCLHP